MSLQVLASLSKAVGMELITRIFDKTLEKTGQIGSNGVKTPFDAFDKVCGIFQGKLSHTSPSSAFSLSFPDKLSKFSKLPGLLSKNLSKLATKIQQLASVFSKINEAVEGIKSLIGKSSTGAQELNSAMPLSTHTTNQPNPTMSRDYGNVSGSNGESRISETIEGSQNRSNGLMGDQWDMFNQMQAAQKAAQMFELAVKMAEIRHQAAMSAIRGIRY